MSVTRNSKGLVEALFDSIDRLNKKEIDPETARAISHTAKTIVNVARLELEARRMNADGTVADLNLNSLAISAPAAAS